ncbi:MAG: MATE family efflux transporter [Thermoleophilia bacterium]|nr:MATE family efflux transporter [Thermoleophilia bacterium]
MRLSLPMFVAMSAMMGLNIVDTYFIGRLGTEQLAAMGFTLAVVMAVNSVNMGIGMGTTAVISRVIGRGDVREARRLAVDAIALGVTVALGIVTIGLTTIDPLFRAMGADGQVLEYVRQYMMIWYLGLPLIVIPQVGNSGVRATGDTKTPAMIMVSVLVVNAILDPLLMFGYGPFPEYGLRGAAIATVIAQAIAMMISLLVLRRMGLFALERQRVTEVLSAWKRVLAIGIPAATTQLITPISTGVVTAIVAGYGVAAVAGFGVAGRLEMLMLMFVMALGAALIPFIGQNLGAGLRSRVSQATRAGIIFALGWGLFVWMVALVFGRHIAGVFNDNPAVIAVVTSYMAIVYPSYLMLGALQTVTNSLNALHRPMRSLTISLLRMFVLYVPLAYLGASIWGLTGVWWAAFAANMSAGGVAIAWLRSTLHHMSTEEPVPASGTAQAARAASVVVKGGA